MGEVYLAMSDKLYVQYTQPTVRQAELHQNHRYCCTLTREVAVIDGCLCMCVSSLNQMAPQLWHLSHYTGRLSHAVGWTQSSAHATTGDGQEQAKGTADRCVELVLPTAHDHHHAIATEELNSASLSAQLLVLQCTVSAG